MSAIWGRISWVDNNDNAGIMPSVMRKPYENKCRLDDIREVSDSGLYMGCGIQYITKEAVFEKLPIYDKEAGCCFTADCLLDNRDELIDKLGISGGDIADGSLMYMAYKKWGMKCLGHFRGLFSMAVYDIGKRKLYLATDQFSYRSLYYYFDKGKELVFSTLIEPIRKKCQGIGYNDDYIKDFVLAPGLMPNISASETPYKGVFMLNPGTWLECDMNRVEEHVYFDASKTGTDYNCHNAREYGAYFRKLYGNCVCDALRTSGKVGIAMSSGLDSASVGALAATSLAADDKKLMTYTYIPFEQGAVDKNRNHVLDEQRDVMKLVDMYPNMVPHFMNNNGKNCTEDFDKVLDIMEIPFKAYVNLPNLCEIYERAASEGCKVVLTGQLGNSTVSHGNIDDVIYDLYDSRRFISFLLYLNNYCRKINVSRKYGVKKYISYCKHVKKVYAEGKFDYTPENPFLNADILNGYQLEERFSKCGLGITQHVAEPRGQYRIHFLNKAMYTYLGALDTKMGLTYNIVVRDPTRDMRMIGFCHDLPFRYFGYKGTPRWLIRGNLSDMLPDYMVNKWMRYCVQNVDWYQRIKRDWKGVSCKIEKDLDSKELDGIIDRKAAIGFVSKLPQIHEDEAKDKLMYLLELDVLSLFYSRK
jgi:asparagine synthase (glutamine-hydrolysing)